MAAPETAGTSGSPPVGWYPDPAGTPQWRRWDGTTWGDATMPFGPPPPDPWTLARARAAWLYLRPIAPWAIGAPALGAVALAAQTSTFAVLRTWVRAYLQAALHNRPRPMLPAAATTSTPLVISLTHYAIIFATFLGLLGWLRFSASSIRVAASAHYPRPHSPAASAAILVPFLGPLLAWRASRDCLPAGHEARQALAAGWALVALGEIASVVTYATVLSTPSALAAWVAAGICGLLWIGAAMELPAGLAAIADDHESFGVRLGSAPS